MATAPRAPKAASVDELDEYFSFKGDDGKTYIFPLKTREVMTPRWVRENRRRDETDYFMTLVEALAGVTRPEGEKPLPAADRKLGEECLKALDALDWKRHREVQRELAEHLNVTMGN